MTDRRNFDERAREWDDDPGKVQRAEAVAGAIRAAVPIPAGARALEIGCGTGLLSFALRDDLGHVVLADTSAGMLEVLTEKIGTAGLEGAFEPRRLDIVADPLPPERFDLVYSLMVLHHFADPDAALARSRAVLRPGGWLCVADLDAEDGSFHGPDVDVFHGFDRDDLAHRAAAAGLVDVRVSTAHVLSKQIDGEDRAYPLFLLVGRADEGGQAPG